MVDEFPELRERDVEDLRGLLAMAAAPLRDGADAVLVVGDPSRDGGIRYRHAEGEVVLQRLFDTADDAAEFEDSDFDDGGDAGFDDTDYA